MSRHIVRFSCCSSSMCMVWPVDSSTGRCPDRVPRGRQRQQQQRWQRWRQLETLCDLVHVGRVLECTEACLACMSLCPLLLGLCMSWCSLLLGYVIPFDHFCLAFFSITFVNFCLVILLLIHVAFWERTLEVKKPHIPEEEKVVLSFACLPHSVSSEFVHS